MAYFSYIIGPTLGEVIYGIGDIQAAFLVNGISFAGSGVAELFIAYHQKTKKLEKVQEVINDIKEGIHFIKTYKGLLVLLLFAVTTNLLLGSISGVLIPYPLRVVIEFSAEQLGMLQTSVVVGALVENIVIASMKNRRRRGCITSL